MQPAEGGVQGTALGLPRDRKQSGQVRVTVSIRAIQRNPKWITVGKITVL